MRFPVHYIIKMNVAIFVFLSSDIELASRLISRRGPFMACSHSAGVANTSSGLVMAQIRATLIHYQFTSLMLE